MINQAKILKEQKGILSTPDTYTVQRLQPEIKNFVIFFYNNDALDHIRILPIKKDCVSIAKNIYI